MQFPEKLMNQTWKNDKNLILGTILAHLTQIWALFFLRVLPNETLFEAIILCNLKENWWTKLEKKAKNLILDPVLVCLTQICTPSPQKTFFGEFYLH